MTGGADVRSLRAIRRRLAGDGVVPEDWEAPDGTRWFYFPPWRQWTGWQPHEDGHWQLSIAEFRRSYPGAPLWDRCGECGRSPCAPTCPAQDYDDDL